MNHTVTITEKVKASSDLPFVLIAGPCAMETRDHTMMMAEKLVEITSKLNIPFVYKSSFDKANRTSLNGKRGIGMEKAIPIFQEVRETFGCPTITDIHLPEHPEMLKDAVDVLQIPAFLCRQTDLLVAAAKSGLAINVKKGQFLAPWDMEHVAKKITESGNDRVMLCERGTSFGYNTLVSDMRSLPTMAATGHPVIYDATHSVQQPGGKGGSSGGQREFVPVLARAAMAVGVAGVFMETHQEPDTAPSDGPNMVPLNQLENVLTIMKRHDEIAKDL